jgi:type IV pilus assembly protein PilV
MKLTSHIRNQGPARSQQGFSLVEVLIALIVLSVGMLGIAVLYVQSMQAGRTSMFRHHAVTLAGDVADRIRANPLAGAAYAAASGTDNSCVAGGVDCDQDEMAANDIFIWQAEAADSIPNGAVTVAMDAATPPNYTITVSWDEPGENLSYSISIPVRQL